MEAGQQVVCVKQHSRGLLVIGKTYTVIGIMECCVVTVDIGHDTSVGYLGSYCSRCGHATSDYRQWYGAILFVPLSEWEESESAVEELLKTEKQIQLV